MSLDTALLEFTNWTNETLYFYRQFLDCYQCPLLQSAVLPANQNVSSIALKTIYHQKYIVSPLNLPMIDDPSKNESCLNYCALDCASAQIPNFADQASLHLTIDGLHDCHFKVLEPGRNNFYPFMGTFLLYLATILALYHGTQYVQKRFYGARRTSSELTNEPSSDNSSPTAHQALKTNGRFGSIDAFRGITILLMIFVNYGAGEYHWLQHAPWDGLHLADVVFPFFVFIMGASIAVGFKNLSKRTTISAGKIYRKILFRSINLFLLGLVINSIGAGISRKAIAFHSLKLHPFALSLSYFSYIIADFGTIRIPGVLQRFALSYGVVASVHLLSIILPKRCPNWLYMQKLFRYFPLWPEYSLAFLMLVLYGYFTFFWRFDANCPVGYVGPGGLYDNMYYPYCVGGAARKIDQLIFTPAHSYKGFFGRVLYDPGQKLKLWHDPEGLLGTTTSIVLTLIGLQVGHILVYNPEPWARFRKWFLMTIVLGALTKFALWILAVPVNKNLWSFTFIALTGCLATVLFSAFHFVIDVRNQFLVWQEGWPFHFAGQNSILLYMGHEIAHDMFPFTFNVAGELLSVGGHVGFLVRNLVGATIWLLISVYLAKKQIFLTV